MSHACLVGLTSPIPAVSSAAASRDVPAPDTQMHVSRIPRYGHVTAVIDGIFCLSKADIVCLGPQSLEWKKILVKSRLGVYCDERRHRLDEHLCASGV